MVLSGHFDLPARAGVLEQVSYIGHDSCSYCEEHGETVKTSTRGHVMQYCNDFPFPEYRFRTCETTNNRGSKSSFL